MKVSPSTILILLMTTALALAASPPSISGPSPSPSPSPSPTPAHINLRQLLSVAGPFSKFLSYLQSTNVLHTFQTQADNADDNSDQPGLTIFVPTDSAVKSAAKALRNLTSEEIKSVLLFHGLPEYYSLSDFSKLSQLTSPVPTFAGGVYSLNFTDVSGTVHLTSGWSNTKVVSSVFSTSPVAIYEVSKMLLPEAIFGTDIPPAPAPAPEVGSTDSDSPATSPSSSTLSQHSTSSAHCAKSSFMWSTLVFTVVGFILFFF